MLSLFDVKKDSFVVQNCTLNLTFILVSNIRNNFLLQRFTMYSDSLPIYGSRDVFIALFLFFFRKFLASFHFFVYYPYRKSVVWSKSFNIIDFIFYFAWTTQSLCSWLKILSMQFYDSILYSYHSWRTVQCGSPCERLKYLHGVFLNLESVARSSQICQL